MRELDLTLGGHERFVELCALYPTGILSAVELASLRNHLEDCDQCRSLLAGHRTFHQAITPLLLKEQTQDYRAQAVTSNSPADAKKKLFDAVEETGAEVPSIAPAQLRFRAAILPLTIAVLALISITGGSTYLAGLHQGIQRASRNMQQDVRMTPLNLPPSPNVLQVPQSVSSEEIRERDDRINLLSSQLSQLSGQVVLLKAQLDQANSNEQRAVSDSARTQAQQSALAANRDALQAQLDGSQSSLGSLQTQLRHALDELNSDVMHAATLQQKNEQFSTALKEKDARIQEQQSLLESDRDVRELMGARDLFIADVFDIARDGKTKSPFGRVFYTKNKSLIFYAFDLDKQQDLQGKQNVAFQVWGLNDADKHHPLNLGIFYVDNQANRRWALHYDDAAVLERINAVFVTAEPNGGSPKPSGKQLLYAYLEAQPNHP